MVRIQHQLVTFVGGQTPAGQARHRHRTVAVAASLQQRPQRHGVHRRQRLCRRVVEKGRGKVVQAHQGGRHRTGRATRAGDDQRYPHGRLVPRALAPAAMVAEHLAVVGGVHHHGVLQLAPRRRRLQQPPAPGVDVLDHGGVVLPGAQQRGAVRMRVGVREREVDLLPAGAHGGGDVERSVRTEEVHLQEPRRGAWQLVEDLQGVAGHPVVAVGIVRQRGGVGPQVLPERGVLLHVALRQAAVVQHLQVGAARRAGGAVGDAAVQLAFAVAAVGEAPFVQQPRAVQLPPQVGGVAGVLVQVELADPGDAVAGGPQRLIEGRLLQWIVVAVARYAAVGVVAPRGERCPRRRAQRRGTVGALKGDPARRQPLQRRRAQRQVPTGKPVGAVLIGQQQQQVGPPRHGLTQA